MLRQFDKETLQMAAEIQNVRPNFLIDSFLFLCLPRLQVEGTAVFKLFSQRLFPHHRKLSAYQSRKGILSLINNAKLNYGLNTTGKSTLFLFCGHDNCIDRIKGLLYFRFQIYNNPFIRPHYLRIQKNRNSLITAVSLSVPANWLSTSYRSHC